MNTPRIVYLSPATAVKMADDWYDIANLEHFWIKRRFEVMRALAGDLLTPNTAVAEIGCGNGLVQRQCEELGITAHGFDLNESALQQNVSQSPVYCYDIHQRNAELAGRFDIIILFDVLEHIEDDDRFLQSTLHHLKPAGHILINVPAMQRLYSAYDRALGHMRRYDRQSMTRLLQRNRLEVTEISYWGLPLLPLLAVRAILQRGEPTENTIRQGFHPPEERINKALQMWARFEPIPQSLYGTSLMAIARRQR